MVNNNRQKLIFFFSFGLTVGCCFILIKPLIPAAFAADVSVSACVPTMENCTNGADDDCDGLTDWDDDDCIFGPSPPPPPPKYCGDGTVNQVTEECDDGNVVSGDGCSAACQVEVGCGDGVLAAGEQCDDGNTVSGDCCSSFCQYELLISNVSESVTKTAAIINWTTACQSTNSTLDWGLTLSLGQGSFSSSGINYSHTISAGLTPNTVYYYKITAFYGSLQAEHSGSFLTLGGSENCTNGIDDDSDGFCDYPVSTCSDGSVSGDSECVCQADFVCQPGPCQADNNWTVSCVDQSIPKCRADYEYQEQCEVCPGVFCGTCQELDEQNCICTDLNNCCGNNSCESPAEDPYNCPGDCPVDCLSQWDCSNWQPEECPPSGFRIRDCFDKNACEIPINPPMVQQSCSAECPGLSCGTCQAINVDQCLCEQLIPCCGNGVCETGESHQQCPQDCITLCQPNWTCLGWGACQNSITRRECYDLNNCDLNLNRPPEIRSCDFDCDVACSTCQQINLAGCRCDSIAFCCGNGACEQGETVWACPVDCGLPPNYRFTLTQCLDGLDNDKDGLVDYPIDPGCSKPADNSELNLTEVLENISDFLQDKIFDNPAVETINEKVAAPVVAVTVVANSVASFSFFNFLSYLRYLTTQPLAALFRRKRKKWGVIYNSLTKQPVDLAIVRLYDNSTKKLVQSRVTDKFGRYTFIAPAGKYYLTVTKPKFDFPSSILQDKKEDVNYLDLYHGELIDVNEDGIVITLNIPLDPQENFQPAKKLIFQYYLRKIQYAAAFSAIPLAAVSLAVSPGVFTFTLFIFHCLLFMLFRRLGYQRPPKSWGVIYDKTNKSPIGRAITRIYDKKYNKLLETRVTDAKGRYAFLVDNNVYYLTTEKIGYKPEEVKDIDLVTTKRDEIVDLDIGMVKGGEKVENESLSQPSSDQIISNNQGRPVNDQENTIAVKEIQPEISKPLADIKSFTQKTDQKVDGFGVGRESLENLLKDRQSVDKIKADISEGKEKIEKLEDKVEKINEPINEKIEQKDQSSNSVGVTGQKEPLENNFQVSEDKTKISKDDIFG